MRSRWHALWVQSSACRGAAKWRGFARVPVAVTRQWIVCAGPPGGAVRCGVQTTLVLAANRLKQGDRGLSDDATRTTCPAGPLVGFSDDDQGISEKAREQLELEKTLLEQHAPEHLDAMFNMKSSAAASAAEAGHALRAAQQRSTEAPPANSPGFIKLRQMQQDSSMGEQRRKAWQKFPNAHSGSAIVPRPRRIILIRHGESLGNIDEVAYTTTPDWKIPLTQRGRAQAADVGAALCDIVGDSSIYIYHSPYVRTADTCQEILARLPAGQVKGVREEPRVSEQQFGNLHNLESIRNSKIERKMYGRFFYRFKNGEAGLDVYSRISSFIGTLRRDHLDENCTVIIVTHGLALRLFLMRFFQWTVEQFEATHNPPNCGLAIMERLPDGRYRLTPSSLDMIGADQAPRMSAIGREVFRRAFVDTFLSY